MENSRKISGQKKKCAGTGVWGAVRCSAGAGAGAARGRRGAGAVRCSAGVRCGCGGAVRGAVRVRGCGGRGSAGQAKPAWRGRAGDAPQKASPALPRERPPGHGAAPTPGGAAGRRKRGRGRMRQAAQKKGRRRQSASPSRPLTGLAPVRDVICQGSPCRWSARRNTRPPRPKPPPQRRGAARRRSWGGRRGPPRQKSGWCGWAL